MLETPHIFVGALIATKVANPMLAVPLALGSHFVLDMLPHWNPHINREIKTYGSPTMKSKILILFDSVFGLISGLLIAFSFYPDIVMVLTVLLCCFAAVLPDIVEIPYYFFGRDQKWAVSWIKWQKSIQNDVAPLPGVLSQILVVVASLAWIKN